MDKVSLVEYNTPLTGYNGQFPSDINGSSIYIHYELDKQYQLYISIFRIFKPRSILMYRASGDSDGVKRENVAQVHACKVYGWPYTVVDANSKNIPTNQYDMVFTTNLDPHIIGKGWSLLGNGGYFITVNYEANPDAMLYKLYEPVGSQYYGVIKYTYNGGIYPIWVFRKLQPIPIPRHLYDPELVIRQIKYKDMVFNVIREDMLIGGTKQRIAYDHIRKVENTNIFYRGAVNGYAQVAMAYICSMIGKRAHMIVNTNSFICKHKVTCLAMIYGCRVHPIPKPTDTAHEDKLVGKLLNKYNGYLIPMGLVGEGTEDIYTHTHMANIVKYNPKRMWVMASTCCILRILHHILPTTQFHAVFAHEPTVDISDLDRVTVYVSPEKYWREDTTIPPPYPSEASYDAKIWRFVTEYGQTDDYILNIAGL